MRSAVLLAGALVIRSSESTAHSPRRSLALLPCVVLLFYAITLRFRMRMETKFRSLWSQWDIRCLCASAESHCQQVPARQDGYHLKFRHHDLLLVSMPIQ